MSKAGEYYSPTGDGVTYRVLRRGNRNNPLWDVALRRSPLMPYHDISRRPLPSLKEAQRFAEEFERRRKRGMA